MTPEFEVAHQRLVAACTGRSWRDKDEDPEHPETIQAMQLALNMPKSNPPSRIEMLESAARAVVAVCLDDR
ncbi:ACR protein, partial [Pseudomonas aeruginosa]